MEEIFDLLFLKLTHKGLMPVEIPRIIKDVVNIVNDGGEFTAGIVNERLEHMGWGEQIIDEFTFELIIFFLENRDDFQVVRDTVH